MRKYVLFVIIFISMYQLSAATPKADTIAVGFYNVENLYDTVNDPKKNDEEFLPEAKRNWTKDRFEAKLNNLSKVIGELNSGKGPDVLGLAEVENKFVVEELAKKCSKFKKYSAVHFDSPDERGIDVAMLFNSAKFKLLSAKGDSVQLTDKYPTRLILHAVLLAKTKDTLHVFVNHWPSRRNGQDKSEINRINAAQVLKQQVNLVLKKNPLAKIVIVGDFNDEPENISIKDTLGAALFTCDSVKQNSTLKNVSWERKSRGEGSLKFRDTWNLLDQIIISKGLLKNYICGSYDIHNKPYLLQTEGKFAGSPWPTFGGEKYLNGYSDHLAVYAKFVLGK